MDSLLQSARTVLDGGNKTAVGGTKRKGSFEGVLMNMERVVGQSSSI